MDRILIIDDEAAICSSLAFALEDTYAVSTAVDAASGIRMASDDGFDLVLLDLRIGADDGIEVLSALRRLPDPPVVIMMSAYGTIESSVEAMRRGAFGYLQKPLRMDELAAQVVHALEFGRLNRRVVHLNHELEARYGYGGILGKSAAMRRVFELVERLKDVDTTVVVRGESGTGKELISRALHYSGKRKAEPFVEINCGAIPESLLEGELFGYRRGAFTGAVDARQGKFAFAGSGTLLLDEIGDMPLPLQVKLLQVLQQKEVTPLGANQPVKVNARVVAATNADLASLVESGGFRRDLFFRLKVVEIFVPPLRDRREDIPLLANYFIASCSKDLGKEVHGLSGEAARRLLEYDYPGNVRELANVIEHGVLMADGPTIGLRDLPPGFGGSRSVCAEPADADIAAFLGGKRLAQVEAIAIKAALERNGGRRRDTAESLGISERGLRNKISEYGLNQVR
ncbi:MAG: sigma-54-dependent Fis family transcriptional regulator [Spirochaetae bacterium HGW-Spirochaetae-3]|jgi:two-component system response regulator AtoC|nr:MAG: sigma-54-dependent Fis family transcriptional regulator [Spirochaetae bacterium HGW-Spirochaetae-3]